MGGRDVRLRESGSQRQGTVHGLPWPVQGGGAWQQSSRWDARGAGTTGGRMNYIKTDMTHEETRLRAQVAEVTKDRDEWRRKAQP